MRQPLSICSRRKTSDSSIDCFVGQTTGLSVLGVCDFQEAHLNSKVAKGVANSIQSTHVPFVEQITSLMVLVAVAPPSADPVGHALDHVSRVGLDDDLVDVAPHVVRAIGDHVLDIQEGHDHGLELSTVFGYAGFVIRIGPVVD